MSLLQLLFLCAHVKACSFIHLLRNRELLGFGELTSFWIPHSCPPNEATLFLIFAPKRYYLTTLFFASSCTPPRLF